MQLLLILSNADSFGIRAAEKRVTATLSIGRGKQAGWPLADPTRMLSAIHCEINAGESGFTLTDFSRNGTRLNGETIVRMVPTPVSAGDQIEIGPYLIRVKLDDGWTEQVDSDKTVLTRSSPVKSASIAQTPRKTPPTRRPAYSPHVDGVAKGFVDAFCEGAEIDANSIAGRADLELAQELGSVIGKLASGLWDISSEIYDVRAMIGSATHGALLHEINTPQPLSSAQKRAALERIIAMHFGNLREDNANAGESLGAVIDDALRHHRAVFYAMQTALFRLLNELSPTAIERTTNSGLIRSKSAKNWNAYTGKWEELNRRGENGMLDIFLLYFGEAYDTKIQSL